MIVRYTKIIMIACLGACAFLVTFNNLTDFAANRPFVEHVLSMDSTFHDPAVAYRAVDRPALWMAGYAVIILGEALTTLLMLTAAYRLFAQRHAGARAFEEAKSLFHAAALAGFLVWFLGFMTVGGEWFLMWQSRWNGQEAAFRFYVTIVLVLIYVSQPERDLV